MLPLFGYHEMRNSRLMETCTFLDTNLSSLFIFINFYLKFYQSSKSLVALRRWNHVDRNPVVKARHTSVRRWPRFRAIDRSVEGDNSHEDSHATEGNRQRYTIVFVAGASRDGLRADGTRYDAFA